MQPILIALALLSPPSCGDWSAGYRSGKDVRRDAKRRVMRTARAMGASRETARVLRAMAIRESQADPCAVHTFGVGEFGIGVLGLSVRWHIGDWDRHADAAVFESPEVSTVVALRIFRRAVIRHGAETWTAVNSVFGTGRNQERPVHDARFCELLRGHDVDCNGNPSGQLGRTLGIFPTPDQWAFIERLQG
jgi:hypothetical protein